MDSKNIYIACCAMLRKIEWRKPHIDSEWEYIGEASEVNTDVLQTRIDQFFPEDSLYLVLGRHDSGTVERALSALSVQAQLRAGDAILCDRAFKKFMEFDRIGVVRQGVAR